MSGRSGIPAVGSIVFITSAAALLLSAAACSNRDSSASGAPAAGNVAVICTRCEAAGTMKLSKAVRDETWPKECASCKRWGAFPSAACTSCGKTIALIDSRTQAYGEPQACPKCGKAWHASTTAP